MHGEFHVDAFLIFLGIGTLVSMIVRFLTRKLKRWLEHVNYLRKYAGGTLVADAAADFWLRTIQDPTYVPQWRWTYANKYRHVRPKDERHARAKRIAKFAVPLVVIAVALAVAWPYIGSVLVTPRIEVPATTGVTLLAVNNMTLESWVKDVGYTLELNGTTQYRNASNPYMGGAAGLLFSVARTDSAYADADVFINFTSFIIPSARETTNDTYVSQAWWYEYDEMTERSDFIAYTTGQGGQFGANVTVPGRGYVILFVVMEFRAFDTFERRLYAHIIPSNADDDGSSMNIYGGYYNVGRPYEYHGA